MSHSFHPDRWLPAHITGQVVLDPYARAEQQPRVQRVAAEVVAVESVIDLRDEVHEAELVTHLGAHARFQAALAAYGDAQELAPDTVRIPKYALDLCEHGQLHRRALTAAQ